MDKDLRSFDDSSLVLGPARLRYDDVKKLEKDSSELFSNTFGEMIADDGIIMRRLVKTKNKEKITFIEWLYHNIVTKSNSSTSIKLEQRCFLLSGRAGQGKSTICRKLFLHLKDQERESDAKLLPHYLEEHDSAIKDFFKRIQPKSSYVQARLLSNNVAEHKHNQTAKLIIIDGLDEIDENEIEGTLDNIVQMIVSQQEALFLFSSRSRQHSGDGKPETIYLKELKKKMQNANLNQSLEGQIVSVVDLSPNEKKSMYGLLNEDVKLKSPRLERLVENDSDYLKRPADFHILKSEDIQNGVQYYLETTRWLLRREMGKSSERKELVQHLSFESLLDGTYDFEKQRYNLNPEIDPNFLKTMKTFNLVEMTNRKQYYLDLRVPSSLGMLICMYNDIEVVDLVDENYSSKIYQFEKPKEETRCRKLEEMFDYVIETRDLSKHIPSSLHRFASTLLHGSTDSYQDTMLDRLYSQLVVSEEDTGRIDFEALKKNVRILIFIADVLHPEDEMEVGGFEVKFDAKLQANIGKLKFEFDRHIDGREDWFGEHLLPEIFPSDETFDLHPLKELISLHLALYSRFAIIGPGYEASHNFTEQTEEEVSSKRCYLNDMKLPNCLDKMLLGIEWCEKNDRIVSPEIIIHIKESANSGLQHLTDISLQSRKRLFQSLCHHMIWQGRMGDFIVPHLIQFCELPLGIKFDSFLEPGLEEMIVKWWTLIGDLGCENSNQVIEHFSNMGLAVRFISREKYDNGRSAAKFLHQLEQQTNSEYLKSLIKAFVLISRIGHLEHFSTSEKEHINDWELLDLPKESVPAKTAFMNRKNLHHKGWFDELKGSDLDSFLHDVNPQFRPMFIIELLDQLYVNSGSGILTKTKRIIAAQTFRDQILIWIKSGDFFAALILAIRTGAVDISSILMLCEMESGGHSTLKKQIIGRYLNRTRITDSGGKNASQKDFWTKLYGGIGGQPQEYLTNHAAKYFSANFTTISDLWRKENFNNEIDFTENDNVDSSNIAILQHVLFYKVENKWRMLVDENSQPVILSDETLEWMSHQNKQQQKIQISLFGSLAPSIEHPLYFYAIIQENSFKPETAIFGVDKKISNLRIRYKDNILVVEEKVVWLETPPVFCWECKQQFLVWKRLPSKKLSRSCESCGFEDKEIDLVGWRKFSLVSFYSSIQNGHYSEGLMKPIPGTPNIIPKPFKRKVYIRAVAPFIVHSRLLRKLPHLSFDDVTNVKRFLDEVWGSKKKYDSHIPRLYKPVTLMQSLIYGNDYAITSWHVPEEFHNPKKLEPPHRGFLEHLLQDSLLLEGIQFPMSKSQYADNEPVKMWNKVEVFPHRKLNKNETRYIDIPCLFDTWTTRINAEKTQVMISSSKGAYSLVLGSALVNYPKDEVAQVQDASVTTSELGKTKDYHSMSATTRSLKLDKLFIEVEKVEKENNPELPIQLGLTHIASAQLSGSHGIGGFSDFISIQSFSGRIYPGMNNYVYGHKVMFVDDENEEKPYEGIVEIIEERFTGKKQKQTIASFVEFSPHFLTNPLYASSDWKIGLLDCNQVNEKLSQDKRLFNGSRTIRTWGIITDDGEIDDFKINRIKEKIAVVESNIKQFSENQRVTNGRTNLLNLIKDVMTTFSEIEWLPSYKESFDEIASKIRDLFTKIIEEEKNIRGENSKGTQQDLETIDAILVGLETQYERAQKSIDLEFKKFLSDLKSQEFKKEYCKEKLKHFAYHFDEELLKNNIDNSQLTSVQKRELQKYCEPRTQMKIRVLGLSREKYPPEMKTHWGEVLGSLVDDEYYEIGSIVRFDIKIEPKAGVRSLLLTNILLARDELSADGKLIPELILPQNGFPSPLPTDTWLEVNADKEAIKNNVHPSFNLNMFIKPGKLYAFHPALDVEVPIFKTSVSNEWIGRMCQCEIEIRRDRKKGLFRYYVVDIKPLINSV